MPPLQATKFAQLLIEHVMREECPLKVGEQIRWGLQGTEPIYLVRIVGYRSAGEG